MNLYQFLDLILVLDEALAGLEVSLDHLLDETREIDLTLPAKKPFSFSRITEEKVDFGGTEVLGINLDDDVSSLHIDTLLFDTFTPPLDLYSKLGEGSLYEFADRVSFAGCQYEVLGGRLLKHEPHALNVVLSMSPITLSIQVTEV